MATTQKYGKILRECIGREVRTSLHAARSLVVTNFGGVPVADLQRLRRALDKSAARYLVVKNTVARRALKEEGFDPLLPLIGQETGIVISGSDPVTSVKVVMDFAKENDKLTVKGGLVEGRLCDVEYLKTVAALPSREVLIAQVLGLVKSPVTNFVGALKGVTSKLVCALEEIRKNKKGEAQNG